MWLRGCTYIIVLAPVPPQGCGYELGLPGNPLGPDTGLLYSRDYLLQAIRAIPINDGICKGLL